MHTKTAAAVLRPLADAVSALIVIISDSEISGTPTPDLSKLSQAVDAQIKNLVNVAKKIMDQPTSDAALKTTMPPACNQVLNASSLLISSTSDLLLNPVSSKGRLDLLEAVKGILGGTTNILDVFDDSEIFKIVTSCTKIRNLLSDLEFIDRTAAGHAKYLHTIKVIHQTTITCLQLSSKRIKEILSDKLVTELQDAIDCAAKECPFFISYTKLALTWADSTEAFEAQKVSRTRLTTELFRIERAVSSKGDDEISPPRFSTVAAPQHDPYLNFKNILLATPFSHQWKESAPTTRDNVDSFIGAAKDKVNQKNDVMELLTSPSVIEFPAKVLAQASPFFSAFSELVQDATLGLNEARCDQDSKELINAIDSCISALDTNQALGIISELIGLLGDLSDTINPQTTVGSLNDAVNKADASLVGKATGIFDTKSKILSKLVEHVLKKMSKNHPDYEPIATFLQRADNSIPSVLCGSKLYQKHPEEEVGTHLQNSLLTYADAVKGIQKRLVSYEGAFKTDELILSAHSLFDDNASGFIKYLASKDAAAAANSASLAAIAATQILSIMEREKDNTEDADYKAGLEKELLLIRAAVPQVILKSGELLLSIGQNKEEDVTELNKIISALSSSLTAFGKVVQNYKGTTHAPIVIPTVNLWQPPPAPIIEDVKVVEEVNVTPEGVATVGGLSDETKSRLISASEEAQDDQMKGLSSAINDIAGAMGEVPLTGGLSYEDKARLIAAAEEDQDVQLKGLTSAIKEVVIVMEEAPHLLSETEAEADPMKAAGQELKVEASHWASEHNMIVSEVNRIGELFLLLSEYHKELSHNNNPQSKKSFIQTAQEIMLETGKLVKAVEPLIKSCADKRLAIQISQTTTRTSTFAQTLKVVAAVKASSPRDTDKGVQLISNAQNLMHSVKHILRDAISCSLRLKAGSEFQHFKKVIYAKGIIVRPSAKANRK